MRIVVLHPSDELYGADKVLLQIVQALEGHELEIWLPDDVDYPEAALSRLLEEMQLPVRRLSLPVLRREYLSARRIGWILRRAYRLSRLLRETRPDLLYVNTAAFALAPPIARLHRIRVLAHVHESLRGAEGALLAVLLGLSHEAIAVSHGIADHFRPGLRKITTVVYNGIEAGYLRPTQPEPPITFLIASRWNTWKGHRQFLQAWAQISRRDVRLLICGSPPVSGQAVDVPGLVAALPNRETVHIAGPQTNVEEWIARAHVVVVPSVQPDPLPTIAIEAIGGGRAVFASDVGGLPEIVQDGLTGRLLPPGDVVRWSQAIESVTLKDAIAYGQAATDFYHSRFAVERFRQRIRQKVEQSGRAGVMTGGSPT